MRERTKISQSFEAYMRYYPDKWAAISALRGETGMDFAMANQIINELFGVSDEAVRLEADAEHEEMLQAQQVMDSRRKRRTRKAKVAAGIGFWAVLQSLFSSAKK